MDLRRSIIVWLAIVGVLLTASAATIPQDRRCSMVPERLRVLDLTRPADATHLAADLDAAARIAASYREFIRAQPLKSASVDARLSSVGRPDRAYRYCRAILAESLSRIHHVDAHRFLRDE